MFIFIDGDWVHSEGEEGSMGQAGGRHPPPSAAAPASAEPRRGSGEEDAAGLERQEPEGKDEPDDDLSGFGSLQAVDKRLFGRLQVHNEKELIVVFLGNLGHI